MIHKIKQGEYLKRYDNMTAAERSEYERRVGEWLHSSAQMLMARTKGFEAKVQNVMVASDGWNDRECEAWMEGVRLLSALMGTEITWLPDMLYTKAVGRAFRQMHGCLLVVDNRRKKMIENSVTYDEQGVVVTEVPAPKPLPGLTITEEQTRRIVEKYVWRVTKKKKDTDPTPAPPLDGRGVAAPTNNNVDVTVRVHHPAGVQISVGGADGVMTPATSMPGPSFDEAQGTPIIKRQAEPTHGVSKHDGNPTGKPSGTVAAQQGGGKVQGTVKAVPVRPKSIHQYVHLLPRGTQERAAQVGDLLRDLDVAREKARVLMEAGEQGPKVAQWARAAAKLDEKVKGIYRELDREWARLVEQGRVVVDDLGMAHVLSEEGKVKSEQLSEQREKSCSHELPNRDDNGQGQFATAQTEPTSSEPKPKRTAGRKPLTDEQKQARAEERRKKQEAKNKRKAALIRKWLVDRRNAKTPEQVEKWTTKYREMVFLGGEKAVTVKVRETAAFYGIDMEKLNSNKK